MQLDLKQLQKEAELKIAQSKEEKDISAIRIEYLGRKDGKLNNILKSLKDLPLEERQIVGPLANEIREFLEEALDKKLRGMQAKSLHLEQEWIDVSQPALRGHPLGRLHPITQVRYELEDLFLSMGFMVLDGPEVESDYYNFEALNIPPLHPAREMQDTFWLSDGHIMRTHTSAVQVRALEEYGVPLRGIIPGRCFRHENVDASHEHTFYQIEGMMVDKDLSIAHLIGVMKELLRGILKQDVSVRLRPGYFPFVEPGFELDIRCLLCNGAGCSTCKRRGWLEILPCGMIHPKVLKYGGVDAKKYSGFAFAVGLDRLVMMRYGIKDIRYFHENDVRFLQQF
ncbi:MAG: phenylalanine--tRNA ligase subunit alpha [Parcubacteria group bacterium]|nr:phenylalanine--tRNA ligase subunit alpha [Parcubacteria group bacterium]